MRNRRAMHMAATGVLLAAPVALASPAAAVPPEKIEIIEPIDFVAEDYCDVAGFDVQISGVFEAVLQIRTRRGLEYFSEHQSVTTTHSVDGRSISVVSKPFFKDLHIEDQGDTLLITAFGTGPESVYGPDGKAIARNPGQFRFLVTIDKETGEELSFELIKESTGRNDDFCAAVLPVLQG
jgi:hypothetical protein